MDSKVVWRDLQTARNSEIALDLLLWLPWLFLAGIGVWYQWWWLAIPGWFFFFLTGLRQSHEAFHRTLGVPPLMNELILVLLSPLMLCCLHATRYAHLRHHRYCLADEDIEGEGARLVWWKAIMAGPVYPVKSHFSALKSGGPYTRRYVLLEAAWIVSFYLVGILVLPHLILPHLAAMVAAQWVISFFAVWMVHHDTTGENPSRTIRGQWKAILSYNMFYHFEHHAFPKVPTRKLPELARRMDAAGLGKHAQVI